MRDAVGNRRVDGVFGDIAAGTPVIVALAISTLLVDNQRTTLLLHLVGGLPGPHDDLARATHRLAVGGHHRDCAQVMQDVFGGDGLAPDAALGKGQVFGDRGIEVMADHQHVKVLVERVDGVGASGVGRRGQHIRLAHHLDDVGCMAATGTLGVIRVDHPAFHGGDRCFDEARLIERVGMDGDLHVVLIGHRQRVIDGRWRRAPVFVQFQSDRTGLDLLDRRPRQRHIALAGEAEIHRKAFGGLEHLRQMPRAGRDGGGAGAGSRPGAAANHGGDARG